MMRRKEICIKLNLYKLLNSKTYGHLNFNGDVF